MIVMIDEDLLREIVGNLEELTGEDTPPRESVDRGRSLVQRIRGQISRQRRGH